MIARFWDVKEGSVKIGGVDVRDITSSELMNQISYVFQDSKLLKMSILENVRLGKPDATDEEVMQALKDAQCMDIIDKFKDGVHTMIGAKGIHVSGGEAQRLSIARAFLKNAPVLILDEATAFADPDNEQKVQKAFENLSKRQDRHHDRPPIINRYKCRPYLCFERRSDRRRRKPRRIIKE